MLKSYLENIYQSIGLHSSHQRRKNLVLEMEALEKSTIQCFTCPGTCCTSQANSMQITPIEALEILDSLKIESMNQADLEALKSNLQKTISSYRLNVEIYTGKKHSSNFRKTYTCPFFMNGSKGCGLSRSAKPYGCLGFNPKEASDNGKSCSSNTALLSEREQLFLESEVSANQKIKTDLGISWEKQSIPEALLDVISKLKT